MKTPRKGRRHLGHMSATSQVLSLLLLFTVMPTAAHAALSCTVQTQAVNFASYDPKSLLPSTSSGTIEVKCTCSLLDCIALGYSVEISSGASGSTSDRRLRRAGQSSGGLQYGLYRDATRLLTWETGANRLSALYLLALFGTWQTNTVYGAIPAGQLVESGAYSDAPAVLISY